ncbi:MAG: hypothetical protein LBS86_02710 [Treponema sp.]|jgi:hypothetical protein|nr:hypothetical protein [Treponema sp.]
MEKSNAHNVPPPPPPRGTWIYETPDEIVIGATECEPTGVVLVLPAIVLIAASVGGMFWDGFTVSGLLVGMLFLLLSCSLGVFALTMLFGKVEVVIGKESYVFNSVFKIGKKEIFDWNTVITIYEQTITSPKSHPESCILIKVAGPSIINVNNGTLTDEVHFGGNLTDERRRFLLNALQYYHHNHRNVFLGEKKARI